MSKDEFCDPKITVADDSPDCKSLFARLTSALVLYIASAAARSIRSGAVDQDSISGALRREFACANPLMSSSDDSMSTMVAIKAARYTCENFISFSSLN